MFRKKFLSIRELEEFVNVSSDEVESTHCNVNSADITNIIVLPPENVDALSDCEELDDNVQVLHDDNRVPNELAGEVELECTFDDLNSNIPCEKNGEFEIDVAQPQKSVFSYQPPKWSKSHRNQFSKAPVDVSNEKIREIYEKIGTCFLI